MNAIKKQYVLTVYTDGTFRITERKLTQRGFHGHFVGRRREIGTTVCPICGTNLKIVKEAE